MLKKRSDNMAYNPNIDYAAEIEKEFQKGKPSWSKIATLAQARNKKIEGEGIQTKSTQDYINELMSKYGYADPSPGGAKPDTNKNVSDAGILAMPEQPDPQQQYQDMISDMLRAQRQSRYAQLDKARDSALANLDEQEAGIKPRYYDARNQAAAQSDIGALNFAQYMASRGVKGSQGGMPEIYRNAALQGQIGSLDRQEQAAYDQIARDRTGIQNAYEADRAAAAADIDAQGLQAYIDQMNADRLFKLQEAGVTGVYGGTPTLQAKNQAFQNALAEAGVTGTYKGTPTLEAQNMKFNQGIAEAGVTGMYNGQPTFDYQKWLADNEYRDKTFDENVRQFEMQYGLNLKRMELDEAQRAIDNAYRQGQLTLQQAQQALAEAKFIEDQKQNSTGLYNTYMSQAMQMLQGTYDSATGKYVSQYTPEQVKLWILSLPLSDEQIANILNGLGL